jgi:hypothetical protein
MLPFQLVPYFQYTVESMVRALLTWREFWKDPGKSGTAYETAQRLDDLSYGESGMTSWRLRCWALIFQGWLRRAQGELSSVYNFSSVEFHAHLPSVLDELYGYFEALSRGPPCRVEGVVSCVRKHAEKTGRFLLGAPSQER